MAIDKSATARLNSTTVTGTTLVGTWTLVTCPSWARWAEIINDTGAAIQMQRPAVADAGAYAAADPQVTIAPGGRLVIELSEGRAKPDIPTFSVRTAAAQSLRFVLGGSGV